MQVSGFWFASVIYLTILGKAIAQAPRIVCYYTNWSVFRMNDAKFDPQLIKPHLCTHLIFAYARITTGNSLEPFDSYQDLKKGGYAKFNEHKTINKDLKTLLAVRSNDINSKFSPLVGDPERRQTFNKNVIKYLREHHFDGLDLNWQHPTFGNDSKPEDRANYALFVQDLREEFGWESSTTGQTRLLLTVTISPFDDIIDQGYDVKKLSQFSDWLNVVTYNYHNASAPATYHHAPLYATNMKDQKLNVNFSVQHLISSGANPEKLVIGIPTYGRSYTLSNSNATDFGSPTAGPGKPGNGTVAAGSLAYFEICQNIKSDDKWKVIQSNDGISGPYAYKDDQWISYDDETMIRRKGQYVVKNGLGGVMFWTVDMDDFRGICTGKPYPLIEAVKDGFSEAKLIKSSERLVKTAQRSNTLDKLSSPPEINLPMTTESTLKLPETLQTSVKCEKDVYFPHPTDCKKYFFCNETNLGPTPHEISCPSNLLFNQQTNNCDYARNVICSTSQESKPIQSVTDKSTGRSGPTSIYENDDRDIADPKIIRELIGFIKRSGGLEPLKKQIMVSASKNLPTFENIKPNNGETGQETINVTPKANRNNQPDQAAKLEKLSDFKVLKEMQDSGSVREHRINTNSNQNRDVSPDGNDVEFSGDGKPSKNIRHLSVQSQHNNVSWIVFVL